MTVKKFLYSKGLKKSGIYSTNFMIYYRVMLGMINISGLKNEYNEYNPDDLERLFEVLEKIKDIYKIYNEIDKDVQISIFDEINKGSDYKHLILKSKYGKEFYIQQTVSKIRKDDETFGIVVVFRDISEEEKKRKKIEELSYKDALTKIGNRRYFEEKIKVKTTNTLIIFIKN